MVLRFDSAIGARLATWIWATISLGVLWSGCIAGEGEGWVTGSLHVDNCSAGTPLDKKGDFDLGVDFFAAEPFEDSTALPAQRRNSLTLRLQNTSNKLEESDGLIFQFIDLDAAARSLAQRELLPITSWASCTPPCGKIEDQLRARLYLFAMCPDCRQPLVASHRTMGPAFPPQINSGQCLVPSREENPSCPSLSAADRQTLDDFCSGNFNDRNSADQISQILGDGACMYFCQLGSVRAGQNVQELQAVRIDFGDRVAALFALNIIDARSVELGTCAAAAGQIRGVFNFEVTRGRAVQAFP